MEELSLTTTVLAVIFTFLIAAVVKGATGLGMPQVATPILASFLGVRTTVVILSFPMFYTNAVQAVQGGYLRHCLRRYCWLILSTMAGSLVGVKALASFGTAVLFITLGLTVIAFVLYALLRPTIRLPREKEQLVAPLVGGFAGILGGMTAISGPPLIIYLYCLGLSKEEFIPAISLVYVTSNLTRTLGMYVANMWTGQLFLISLLCCIPTWGGFVLGRALQRRINQQLFFRIVLGILFVLGIIMLRRGIVEALF